MDESSPLRSPVTGKQRSNSAVSSNALDSSTVKRRRQDEQETGSTVDEGLDADNGQGLEQLQGQLSESGDAESTNSSENLFQFWEESVRSLRNARLSAPSQETISLSQKMADARIGGALVRFCGVGDVHGVVDLSGDPNSRGNPRPIMGSHVDALANNLRRQGAKRDHEAPVLLMIQRELIDPECLEAMSGKNPRDITSVLPFFRLVRDHGQREDELEERIWSQRVDRRMLTAGEIHADREELDKLRAERLRATLMNGNHRFQAMLRLASELEQRRDELNQMLDSPPQGVDTDTIKRMMEVLNREVMELTWRVEVYDERLVNGEVRNALVKNEDEKPAEGMGAGEKAWWTAELFAVRIEAEMSNNRAKSREDAASVVAAAWQKETGEDFSIGVVEEVTDSAFVKGGLRQPRNSPVGPENISKLFKESTCMEMVLNTRSALWIWSNCLTREQATLMLKPRGAALVAHFWLSTLTALKVFNVQHPEGLGAAEVYLMESKLDDVSAQGDQIAREHWNRLHARHERSPQPLGLYDERAQQRFGSIYRRATASPEFGREILNSNFTNRDAIIKMRHVFDEFAGHYQERRDVVGRAVCASLRLYARLPLHAPGQTGDCFYPEALLPSVDCMRELEARWNKLEGIHGETLTSLEVLICRQNIAWTIGALGSSQATNTRNWYNRSRGLHQVVRHCYTAAHYGSVEARLSQALSIIQDPDLIAGLTEIAAPVSSTLRNLIVSCSASKSGKIDYPILAQRLADWPQYKSAEQVKSDLSKFRMALKHAIRSDNPATQITQAVHAHPVSRTIDPEFWLTFNLADWVLGWNNKHREKDIKTVSAAVGWGYVIDTLCKGSGLPHLLKDHPAQARPILLAGERLYRVKGRDPWWKDLVSLAELSSLEDGGKGASSTVEELPPNAGGPSQLVATPAIDPQVGRIATNFGSKPGQVPQREANRLHTKARMRMVVELPMPKRAAVRGATISGGGSRVPSSTLAHQERDTGAETQVTPDTATPGEWNAVTMGASTYDLLLPSTHARIHTDPPSLPGAETGSPEPASPEVVSDGTVDVDSEPGSPPPGSLIEEAFEEGWSIKRKSSERTKRQLAWGTRPGYVMAAAAHSTRVLQNLDGQVLLSRSRRSPNDAIDEETVRCIREARVSHPKVLEGITVERERLRASMDGLAAACANIPYSSDWFHSGFQSAVTNLKDIYAARIAGLFMEHVGLSADEAVNEAMSISWTDGLHGSDTAWLDSSGELQLDFSATLMGEAPLKVADALVSYGKLTQNEHRITKDNTTPSIPVLLKSKFRAARGYGDTEKACELAGVEAVALRAKVYEARLDGHERFVDLDGPAQFFSESDQGIDQALGELFLWRSYNYQEDLPFGPKRRRTGRTGLSAFCTGKFSVVKEELSQGQEDTNKDRMRQELDMTLQRVREAWEQASATDLQAFKNFKRDRPTLV